MRDPNRIPIILAALAEVWEDYPDWRLCQLINNVVQRGSNWEGHDYFHLEDDRLLSLLNEFPVKGEL